jgi:PAS domain S-box-containing protein
MKDNIERTPTRESRYYHLVEHIQDAVVEFEMEQGQPIIRDVNKAFVEVFGYTYQQLQGESLNRWIVPEWLQEEARDLDQRTASGEINYRRVERETATGLQEFLYRSIPYRDEAGNRWGFAVYTDLSEITRKERRLQVMYRVLRHNLRNRTNLIVAHTSRLLDALETQSAETTESAAIVERAAHELETLTQEVTEVRRVLTTPDDELSTIDCVPLLQRVTQEHRRRSPQAEIETVLPESMPVQANQDLELAVDQLIDNAIRHNPDPAPGVRVKVADADASGWVRLSIDDDGPEIPPKERAVIAGDADISSTQHGSGLGLWLVKWTSNLFGGDLSFATSDLGGNSVQIRLPAGGGDPSRQSAD